MDIKPGDAALGVIDFFSVLLPGAITAFLLLPHIAVPKDWPYLTFASVEGWAAFVVSAYVLGHLLNAIGSYLVDPLYDRTYVRWQRASVTYVKAQLGEHATRTDVFLRRVKHVLAKSNPDDVLLAVAKQVKLGQLRSLGVQVGVSPNDISNTFFWAGTVVRNVSPAGTIEVEQLTAQSKFFRTLVVVVPIAVTLTAWRSSFQIGVWIAVLIFCFANFCRLRWNATKRTYEYFIAAAVLPHGPEPTQRQSPA